MPDRDILCNTKLTGAMFTSPVKSDQVDSSQSKSRARISPADPHHTVHFTGKRIAYFARTNNS